MWRVDNTDNNGGSYPSPQAEPQCGADNRYVIESLKYVVEHRLMERSQIMEKADPNN